jgi:hypothetical protein
MPIRDYIVTVNFSENLSMLLWKYKVKVLSVFSQSLNGHTHSYMSVYSDTPVERLLTIKLFWLFE